MDELKKYLNGEKKLFLGITLFETVLFLSSFIIATIFTFLNGTSNLEVSDWIIWIDLALGIVAAVSLSRKWKWSWLLLLIDALLYGSVMILTKNYALGIVNAVISPIILLLSLVTWKKHKEEGVAEIETRKLNLSQGILITFIISGISIGVGFLTIYIRGENANQVQDWMNAFAATITIFAMIASILRYRETFFFYFVSNTVKIIMFSILIFSFSKTENTVSLIMAFTYFINAIYGMLIWKNTNNNLKEENN